MSKIPKLIITAHCDKAARPNNEDNCLVRANLSQPEIQHVGDGAPYLSGEIDLDEAGCLLVVADGMGGMNAGEVASRIAVEAVSKFFDTQLDGIPDKSDEEIFRMIEEAIVYADENIKFDAEQNAEHSGMGTTIAILWLLNEKAYIGWCGDSRIYCYNTNTRKLKRLTHDHSLVQLLVDEGDITELEAFDHPKNNIIMRSLGDSVEKVKPETLKTPIRLRTGDVFLLCSDGLYGALPDNPRESKLPKDVNIESVLTVAAKTFSPRQLDHWNTMLWDKAEELCHDNMTSILCYVSNCSYEPKSSNLLVIQEDADNKKRIKLLLLKLFVAILVVGLIVVGIVCFVKYRKPKANIERNDVFSPADTAVLEHAIVDSPIVDVPNKKNGIVVERAQVNKRYGSQDDQENSSDKEKGVKREDYVVLDD